MIEIEVPGRGTYRLKHLVLDVKIGSGAFMRTMDDARELANSLVTIANGAGLRTSALITDMDEPLASCAGNAIEVQNAVNYLTGRYRDQRLHQVTLQLGAELLVNAGLASSPDDAMSRLVGSLDDGSAGERFERMVAALGGPSDFLQNSEAHLPTAAHVFEVVKKGSGTVRHIDTRAIGVALIEMGGGRKQPSDSIDHSVGFSSLPHKGQFIDENTPIVRVHANDIEAGKRAGEKVACAYHFTSETERGPVIIERIGP